MVSKMSEISKCRQLFQNLLTSALHGRGRFEHGPEVPLAVLAHRRHVESDGPELVPLVAAVGGQ